MTKRIYILGDTHASSETITRALREAETHKCDIIFQVGDFGHFPQIDNGWWLDFVDERAKFFKIPVYAIAGNHDDAWDWKRIIEETPKDGDGFAEISPFLRLAPRLHAWKWNNRQFVSAMGGYSIDKHLRIIGRDWWPEEVLNPWEVDDFNFPKADILITHDAPEDSPWERRIAPIPESYAHQKIISEIIRHCRPRKHFHGHMHMRLDWMKRIGDTVTEVHSMNCNYAPGTAGILDLDDLSFRRL